MELSELIGAYGIVGIIIFFMTIIFSAISGYYSRRIIKHQKELIEILECHIRVLVARQAKPHKT